MGIRHLLEDLAGSSVTNLSDVGDIIDQETEIQNRLEVARKEAFAEGYLSGRESANLEFDATMHDQRERLIHLLQDVEFISAAAENTISQRFVPLLNEMVLVILPKMLESVLPLHLSLETENLAQKHAQGTIVLRIPDIFQETLSDFRFHEPDRLKLVFETRSDDMHFAVECAGETRVLDYEPLFERLKESIQSFSSLQDEFLETDGEANNG